MDIPLIESLKKYKEHFNRDQFLSLPTDSPFGNLNLCWVEIVIRVECINELIINLYLNFYKSKDNSFSTLDDFYKQRLYTEQIIYWLRKTTDEIISLLFLLTSHDKANKFPKKIKIGSIGELLNAENPFNGRLSPFKDFLKLLNEISNSYKHSFIDSQILNHIGSEYPVVFVYDLPYNDLTNIPRKPTTLKIF